MHHNEAHKAPDFLSDPHLSVQTKEYLKVLNSGGAPIESLTVEEARKVLTEVQAGVNVTLSGIEESEKTVEAGGYSVSLNIVRPEGKAGELPAFIFIHGGGWVLGDYPTHKRMVRDLVVASGYVALFVNYSPSPEAKYPQAINEIYAVTQWVAEHGAELGVDKKRLALVGNSAGGNMAMAASLMAKQRGGHEVKLQLLLWPVTDTGFDTESYKLYGEQRFLTTSAVKWMFDQYTTDAGQRKELYISPLQASVEELQGLIPTIIVVAENDILRDEAEALGRKLDEAGVEVCTVRYNGVIHDFGLLNGFADLPETRSLFVYAAAELRRYLR